MISVSLCFCRLSIIGDVLFDRLSLLTTHKHHFIWRFDVGRNSLSLVLLVVEEVDVFVLCNLSILLCCVVLHLLYFLLRFILVLECELLVVMLVQHFLMFLRARDTAVHLVHVLHVHFFVLS
jgi:hypothetical protein